MSTERTNDPEIYRACFERATIGLALCRLDNGELVLVNQAFADIMGRTVPEVMDLSYWQITPRKFEQKEQEQLRQVKQKGIYGPYEKEYFHKKGTLVPVRLSGQLLSLDGVDYIWSMVEDLSKEKYRILFQQAVIGLALCDMQGEMVDVNVTFADMLGYQPQELEGMTYWNITPLYFHEQELERVNEIKDPMRRAYGPYLKYFIHRDGHLVGVTLNGLVVEIEGVSYIWSIIESGFFGGYVAPQVPPNKAQPIEPPAPDLLSKTRLAEPIKPLASNPERPESPR